MVVGAKVFELTDGFLWFVCGLYVGILMSPLIWALCGQSEWVYPQNNGSLAMAFDEYNSYRCIERVHRSVGTPLCCDRGQSSEWLSTEKVLFLFQLNSNMSNISFVMGRFSYQN